MKSLIAFVLTFFKNYSRINYKTLLFNLKHLPFKQAVRLPFFINKYAIINNFEAGTVLLNTNNIYTGMVKLGFENTGIHKAKYTPLIIELKGKLLFSGPINIGQGCKLAVIGEIEFGKNIIIMANTTLIARKKIKIGNDCIISWGNTIMDTDFHEIYLDERIINEDKPIHIGKNTWIGMDCTILKGTRTPENSIIGAKSLLNSSYSTTNSILVGNPAKIVKENIYWKR